VAAYVGGEFGLESVYSLVVSSELFTDHALAAVRIAPKFQRYRLGLLLGFKPCHWHKL
jgi:hypothetical protein